MSRNRLHRSLSLDNLSRCRSVCRNNQTIRNNNRQFGNNNAVESPEVFQQNFRGRPRQYAPSEFGLTENEQFHHPRIFRNLNYNTDRELFDSLRTRAPTRQPYRPQFTQRLQDLPDERIEDLSAPSFGLSMPSDISNLTNECLNDVSAPSLMYSSAGNQSSRRSECINEITPPSLCDISIPVVKPPLQLELPDECLADESAPSFYQSGASSRNRSMRYTKECLDDVTPPLYKSFASEPSALKPLRFPSECLVDITEPSFNDTSIPAVDQRIEDISAPPFCDVSDPAAPNVSQNERLDDVSAPSFHTTGSSLDSTYNALLSRFQIMVQSAGELSILGDSEMVTDDIFGPDKILPPTGCQGVEKLKSTQINFNTCDSIKETVIHTSATDNGQIEISKKHILSKCDENGNITCHSNETKKVCAGGNNTTDIDAIKPPSFMDSCTGASPAANIKSLRDSVQRVLNFNLPDLPDCGLDDVSAPNMSNLPSMTPENLNDISMPFLDNTSYSVPPQYPSMPSERLSSQSAPSFARSLSRHSSRRQASYPSENICDVSMPSMADVSFGGSPPRQASRRQVSYPSENICDVSMPSISDVSFGGSPPRQASRRQVSYPSENICDVSMPSMADISFGKSPPRQASLHKRTHSWPNECLDNITPPSFGKSLSIQSTPRRMNQQLSTDLNLPSECLDDQSAPSFASNLSRQSPPRRQISYPQENVFETSAPSMMNQTLPSLTCEDLQNVTMPSFDNTSYSMPPYPSMPSERLSGQSAPSFVSSLSRQSSKRQISYPSENICDVSMPSMSDISLGSSPQRRVPGHRRSRSWPSECLDDVSAPLFASSLSLHSPSYPQENIFETSAPSMMNQALLSITCENLDNITMPSFNNTSYSVPVQYPSMPSERLSGQSAPSFARSPRTLTLPSECLDDVSAPSYLATSRRRRATPQRNQISFPSECLDEITPPSFSGHISRRSTPRRMVDQRARNLTLPSECLADESAPSFASSLSRRSPQRRQISYLNENIFETSAPSIMDHTLLSIPCDSLDKVTMPSFDDTWYSVPNQYPSMPSERLSGQSAPSFARSPRTLTPISYPSECLDDVTPPSFGGNISRQNYNYTLPSECLDDQSAPSFASKISGQSPPRRIHIENICDTSAPSMLNESMVSIPQEQLNDVSMPSFNSTGASQRSQLRLVSGPFGTLQVNQPSKQQAEVRKPPQTPNENLDDVTPPSMINDSSKREPRARLTIDPLTQPRRIDDMKLTDEKLEDVSAPFVTETHETISLTASRTSITRREPTGLPSENLGDITPPSMMTSTMNTTRSDESRRRVRLPEIQNIDEITPPSFLSTIPSCDDSSIQPGGRPVYRYQQDGFQTMPNFIPFEEQMRSPSPIRRPNSPAYNPYSQYMDQNLNRSNSQRSANRRDCRPPDNSW